MEGRSQEELVAMLRSTRQGESVSVVVVRQEDIFLPRELVRERERHTSKHRSGVLSGAGFFICFLFPSLYASSFPFSLSEVPTQGTLRPSCLPPLLC